jgi:cell division protein FtsQ
VRSVTAEDLDTALIAETVRATASRRIVLPRFLRRPVRALRRMPWTLPPRAGIKGLVVLFLATAAAGIVIGGHGVTVVSAVTAWSGFAVENVKITGQSETSEVDVLHSLAFGQFPSLLTLDLETAKARVEALPWVKQATLKKLFPDTLEIAIVEREPYALWQHGGEVSLIDRAGKVITDQFSDRYAALPRVVGIGAAEKATAYTALIDKFPDIARQARAGVLVSQERWTVVLDNGIQLMLPADNPQLALATVAALDRDHAVLSRQVAALDLRMPGQFVVRLTEEGVAAQKALLKERDKLAHRGATNT